LVSTGTVLALPDRPWWPEKNHARLMQGVRLAAGESE
jgi:hypothetical protein